MEKNYTEKNTVDFRKKNRLPLLMTLFYQMSSYGKFKFIAEYELRASPKMLFPYISTASGLSQWFASKVNTMPEQRFDFQWDNESHIAKQVSMRQNKGVRFEFLDTAGVGIDNNYIDFRVDQSELTQSTFLRITDYSSTSDEEELQDLWDGLMDKLKEIVGS